MARKRPIEDRIMEAEERLGRLKDEKRLKELRDRLKQRTRRRR